MTRCGAAQCVQSVPTLEPAKTGGLHLKTIVLTLVVILSNVIGNFSLSWGMRKAGPRVFDSPLGYIQALFDPWVALGVCTAGSVDVVADGAAQLGGSELRPAGDFGSATCSRQLPGGFPA